LVYTNGGYAELRETSKTFGVLSGDRITTG
jgi:hypothetical protein